MKKSSLRIISLILLLAACATQESTNYVGDQTPLIEGAESNGDLIPIETRSATGPNQDQLLLETHNLINRVDLIPPLKTRGPDCLGSDPNQICLGISEKFEDATYEQVMLWFCNGAEFEDILVALQTEEQSGHSAEEMLIMLVDGYTWEEIWQSIGLIEE